MAGEEDGIILSQVSFFDRHGFAVYKEESFLAQEDCRSHEYRELAGKDNARVREFWTKILECKEENPMTSPKQLRQFMRQGVPDDLRGQLWNKLTGSQSFQSISSFDYQTTLGEIRQLLVDLGVSEYGGSNCISTLGLIAGSLAVDDKENIMYSPESAIMTRQWKARLHKKISVFRQIMLDVDRSFPSHKKFMDGTSEGKEGRAALFRVLAVYSLYNPEVSYCQGMSYIAGMFLMNMDEEDSFWCLVSMFERPKYLAGYFHDSLSKIQGHAAVFDRLLQQRRTKLYKHLEALGVSSLMYLTPWFMALFTSLPCWDTVLTIWDLLLLQGMSVIFQVALALLDVLSGEILRLAEISQVLPILLRPSAKLTSHKILVPAIWKVKQIQKWEIDSIQAVLDEEKETKLAKRVKRRSDDQTMGNRKKRQRLSSEQGSSEPSLIQRVVGLLNSAIRFQDEPTASKPPPHRTAGKTDNIEMTTFSLVSSQSPGVSLGMCCSSAGNSNITRGIDSAKRPLNRSKNYTRSAKRRSGRHSIYNASLASPVRRSPRLSNRRTPLGNMKRNSPSSLVRSSAKNQHAFKLFNTPTPLRRSQVRPRRRNSPSTLASPPITFLSPDTRMSPDVELVAFNITEKRLDFSER